MVIKQRCSRDEHQAQRADIFRIDGKTVTKPWTGEIHINSVEREFSRDMAMAMKNSDIIKARIINTKNKMTLLSVRGPEYGVVYGMYADPDGYDTAAVMRLLVEQIRETEAAGRRVPPGVHAHLGYLYSLAGKPDAAATHFKAEKEQFPESAVLMDHFLSGL